jgi:AraC-like DNA-binding protein
VRVDRHESKTMRWEMVRPRLSRPLRPYVRALTGYDEWTAAPLRRYEMPSGDVTLILSPDSPLEVPDARHPERAPARVTSFVAALYDSYAIVDSPGRQRGLDLKLTPLGAHALLGGVPMHELVNRVLPVDELLGRDGDELVGRIWAEPDWERRFAALERALSARLADAPPLSSELSWAFGRLRSSAGRVPVAGLARELGWSHRRLIERFRRGIGLPPKTLGRILRFEHVARRLSAPGAAPRLAELALDCGYYDQAHLNRDFRDFAGMTPREYLSHRLPDGGGVTVSFVQDGGGARA